MRILILLSVLLLTSCTSIAFRMKKRECFSYYLSEHGMTAKAAIALCEEEARRQKFDGKEDISE